MKTRTVVTFFAVLAVLCYACSTDEPQLKTAYLDLPGTPYIYKTGGNNHLPTLGRVLFYDRQLSVNNSMSCNTCHKQTAAFADNVAFSKGFENVLTGRNSMPIQNLASGLLGGIGFVDPNGSLPKPGEPGFFPGQTVLFWDGRESNLQSMVLKPVVNHVEMGIRDMDKLSRKLSDIPYYKDLFKNAYGSEEITSAKIAQALSSFLISITSTKTKMDLVGQGAAQFTALELHGRNLFFSVYDCNQCHRIQNPHGYLMAGTFSNIGLDAQYADGGLETVTKRASDAGKFKIPSLRNVALTAPYMHDGRFATLEEVIGHYSQGIEDHPNLDPRLRNENGQPLQMNIPDDDKKAIVAFLNTLTDHEMINDVRFSNPFKAR
jgi:cytochrome c peroxidase